MKIVRFRYKGKEDWGVFQGDQVVAIDSSRIPVDKIKILAPYLGGKIVLAGLNYIDHARELKMKVPEEPVIFIKPSSTVIGPKSGIIYPKQTANLHYEAELAFMIGRKARNVSRKYAARYILGFTCLNDVTARDLQAKDGQWTRAKSFDTFCPLGPWIDTEYDWHGKQVSLLLNGVKMQDGTTDDFIFDPYYLVEFISATMTLYPGDIVSTGTPKGVGPMAKGDRVTVDIEGLGALTNRVLP